MGRDNTLQSVVVLDAIAGGMEAGKMLPAVSRSFFGFDGMILM